MRLDINDLIGADKRTKEILRQVQVKLNGANMQFVTLADEEQGYVMQLKRDAHGNFVIEHGAVTECRIEGKVEIVLPEGITLASLKLAA